MNTIEYLTYIFLYIDAGKQFCCKHQNNLYIFSSFDANIPQTIFWPDNYSRDSNFFRHILFAPTMKLWFWCFHRNYFPATICTFQIFPSREVSSYTYPRRAFITPKHSVPRKSIDRAIGNLVETLFRIVSLCRGGLHLWRGRGISSGWPMKLMMADGT